jgi:hypothetical protein
VSNCVLPYRSGRSARWVKVKNPKAPASGLFLVPMPRKDRLSVAERDISFSASDRSSVEKTHGPLSVRHPDDAVQENGTLQGQGKAVGHGEPTALL